MRTIKCDIQLPASKSESNRALMIAAYGGFQLNVGNLSVSNDTQVMKCILRDLTKSEVVDVQDCGTAARFMLTYLSGHEGHWLLTGTDRMQQRPMKDLILSLRELGADIQCVEKEGFLPVRILGKPLSGGKISVEVTHSSQFASSLLLAAPVWKEGLELELKGELNSLPYIDMTIAMMCHFGAEVERKNRRVIVRPKTYELIPFLVEPDWSSASYWYEIASLSEDCDILLKNLSLQSLQGDKKMAEMATLLGVQTIIEKDGIRLRRQPLQSTKVSFDFSNTPDLFPAVAATCAGLGIQARFMGIENLTAKESNRVEAMTKELSKIGSSFYSNAGTLLLNSNERIPIYNSCKPLIFNTYNDHRIAMALALLRLKIGSIELDHPEVVAKSYPAFWTDLAEIV